MSKLHIVTQPQPRVVWIALNPGGVLWDWSDSTCTPVT